MNAKNLDWPPPTWAKGTLPLKVTRTRPRPLATRRQPFREFARDWARTVAHATPNAAAVMASPAATANELYKLAELAYAHGASLDRVRRLLANVLLEALPR